MSGLAIGIFVERGWITLEDGCPVCTPEGRQAIIEDMRQRDRDASSRHMR